MKNSLMIIILGIGLILASSALAANRVVVIPLGGDEHYMYWQGDWVADKAYKKGDAVHMDGSTYMCITKHTSTDHDYPPYPTYWELIAAEGATGPQGPIAGTNKQFIYNDNGNAAGADMYFDKSENRVGIGTASPTAKLEVISATTGGSFESSGGTGTWGVAGFATNSGEVTNYGGYFQADGRNGRGVYGYAGDTGISTNYGGYFEARGVFGTGVYGYADGMAGYGVIGTASGRNGWGVNGYAGGSLGRGVYGLADGSDGIGVYGYATGIYGVGVQGSGTAYDFLATGPGTNYGYPSSIRWKKNIEEIADALDKVMNLRGVYFDWDEEHGGQHDMGFIAEEVGEQIPEIVIYEEGGVYATGMDYGAITPMLLQAIKEQQALIESQQAQIGEQQAKIEKLEEQKQQIDELRKMVEELQARL